jgi:hypothetical protein
LWDFLFDNLLQNRVEIDPAPIPVVWPKGSAVYNEENHGEENSTEDKAMAGEIKNLEKFNVDKTTINFLPPTHF